MFLLCTPQVSRFLGRYGVICRWRTGMTLDLRRLQERGTLPDGYEVSAWDPEMIEAAAHADHAAYHGSVDAQLYWRYFSTPEGCAGMWREAMAGKFGRFDAERSLLLRRNGGVCGDVMASIRNPKEAFIGNLAVRPEDRGKTGRALLLECLWRYKSAGFERVSLAVTLDNQRALNLYHKLGFVQNGRFPVVARPVQERFSQVYGHSRS
jgi:ribosomal protein S18 acetylase RimI-like enzyme